MIRLLFACALSLLAGPAFAHQGSGEFIDDWEFDPWVIGPLALSAFLYIRGTVLLWRKAGPGRGIAKWQAACFAAGWLTLFGALVSPLHWLGEHLFTAHMIEHELLMAVAAPLLAVSRPLGAFLRALPKSWARGLRAGAGTGAVRSFWRGLMNPGAATAIHAVALWVWHAPALFDSTITNELMHRLQHISFLGTALIFWWALFRRKPADYGMGAVHVFITMMHMGLLGALIALSPHVLYTVQTASASQFGLTPREDQQLGGLVMWIPAGTIYAAVALAMAWYWLTSTEREVAHPR
jgi:cytochrome c oxidase assembly factor CtaG